MFDHALLMLSLSTILMIGQGISGYIVTAVRPFTPVSRQYHVIPLRSLTLDRVLRK